MGPSDPSFLEHGREWEGAYKVIAPTTPGEAEELARCMQLLIALARLGSALHAPFRVRSARSGLRPSLAKGAFWVALRACSQLELVRRALGSAARVES